MSLSSKFYGCYWLFLVIVGSFFVTIALMQLNPILGLLGPLFLLVWVFRSYRRNQHDWGPNVHSENAYAILGVNQEAKLPEIRKACRRRLKEFHPDSVPPDQKEQAADVYIRIGRAFELLANDESRYQYDHVIECDNGRIPPFEEAYEELRDEDKHWLYAAYDELKQEAERELFGDRALKPETLTTDELLGEDVSTTESNKEEMQVVEIPESVKEAMAMTRDSEGSPEAVCRKCGQQGILNATELCDQCSQSDSE